MLSGTSRLCRVWLQLWAWRLVHGSRQRALLGSVVLLGASCIRGELCWTLAQAAGFFLSNKEENICDGRNTSVHISWSSHPAPTCLEFSHLVSPGCQCQQAQAALLAWCRGCVPDIWRSAKAAGPVAKGSPDPTWTPFLCNKENGLDASVSYQFIGSNLKTHATRKCAFLAGIH